MRPAAPVNMFPITRRIVGVVGRSCAFFSHRLSGPILALMCYRMRLRGAFDELLWWRMGCLSHTETKNQTQALRVNVNKQTKKNGRESAARKNGKFKISKFINKFMWHSNYRRKRTEWMGRCLCRWFEFAFSLFIVLCICSSFECDDKL